MRGRAVASALPGKPPLVASDLWVLASSAKSRLRRRRRRTTTRAAAKRTRAERVTAMATGRSLRVEGLGLEEPGRMREEMLAGKEA